MRCACALDGPLPPGDCDCDYVVFFDSHGNWMRRTKCLFRTPRGVGERLDRIIVLTRKQVRHAEVRSRHEAVGVITPEYLFKGLDNRT
jgi:hypothetical protein